MKTILVPTDFSDVANCAITYAAEMATYSSAKLILFHAYRIPVASPDGTVVVPLDTTRNDSIEELKQITEKLQSQYPDITIEYNVSCGFAVDEIRQAANEFKADIIIMGMQGGGFISEKIVGSITTSLIKKSHCPVLAIHKGAKFHPIKKIALACDYAQLNYPIILKPLNDLATLFHAEILIVNVVPEMDEVSTTAKASEGIKLNQVFNGIKHSFHYTMNNDITDGINDFVKENEIDLIAMIPHTHNVFDTLFKESHTKHMAFQVAKPFLAIHDKK